MSVIQTYGIKAGSRKELIDYIKSYRLKIYLPDNTNILCIKCSCERQYNYKNLKNIPYKNVKCECGDFIIFYDNYRDKTFINKLLKQWKTIL